MNERCSCCGNITGEGSEARKYLRSLLAQCTEAQIKVFNLMYVSIDDILEERIAWAIQQGERTLQNNSDRQTNEGGNYGGDQAP